MEKLIYTSGCVLVVMVYLMRFFYISDPQFVLTLLLAVWGYYDCEYSWKRFCSIYIDRQPADLLRGSQSFYLWGNIRQKAVIGKPDRKDA